MVLSGNGDETMGKVTMADVAAHADVSTATVSRVLSGKRSVSPEIRDVVLEAVEALGYKPRRRRKMDSRSGQKNIDVRLGFLMDPATDWYFVRILSGIESVLRQNNVDFTVSPINGQSEGSVEFFAAEQAQRVGGLIIGGGPSHDELFTAAQSMNIPVVLLDRYRETNDAAAVIIDNVRCSCEAVHHLIDTGYSKIAMVNGPQYLPASRDKLLGYRMALAEAGVSFDPELVIVDESYHTWEGGYRAAQQLLGRVKPPFGVFAFDDLMAYGVMKAVAAAGLSVPGDVAVVGFGDLLYEQTGIGLTCIHVNYEHYGRLIAQLLLDLMAKRVYPPIQIAVNGVLVTRESSASGS